MIFLDTTIAKRNDLEFVKFLNIFPRLFCDLTFLEGIAADGNKTDDHFLRDEFSQFSDVLITEEGVKSFSTYLNELKTNSGQLKRLFNFFDGISPDEKRKRWDRLHLFHLTTLMFLNNYGYDFQITNKSKLKDVITKPKIFHYLSNYFTLLKEYHLTDNKKVKMLKNVVDNTDY